NAQDTPKRVAEHAKSNEMAFPILKDPGNKVADSFGARRTPEAFVLDPAGKVLYRGKIDDQVGIGFQRPNKPTRRGLVEAVDEVLAGKAVSVAKTEVAGCVIGRTTKAKEAATVTYAKHVAPVIQKHCQECHRPGQVGPFALMNYDDAVAWSGMIKEVL